MPAGNTRRRAPAVPWLHLTGLQRVGQVRADADRLSPFAPSAAMVGAPTQERSMPRTPGLIILAALATAPLLPSSRSWAASPDAAPPLPAVPPVPRPAPVWGQPPDAVRTAVAALYDACAAWPKLIPPATGPATPPPDADALRHAGACSFVLDPASYEFGTLLEGGALGAAAAGLSVLVYRVASVVLFTLFDAVARGLLALWTRRPRRAHSAPE